MFGVIGVLRGRDETPSTMTDTIEEVIDDDGSPGITGQLVGKSSVIVNCLCEEDTGAAGSWLVVGKLFDRVCVGWPDTRPPDCVAAGVEITGGVFTESQRP